MAATCPPGFDAKRLRDEIRHTYGRVASEPDAEFHFHRGPVYASDYLGYELRELEQLPDQSTASFAGVGNPLAIGELRAGDTVLDIGSGAGMDLLLAARRVGPTGKAIGVDMTEAMRSRTLEAGRLAGLSERIEVRDGDAEDLPVDDGSVDVVISNGVLNLTTDKSRAFSEIHRVLRSGGRLLLADIVLDNELSEAIRSDVDLWTG
jgi:SAM-dependent methyltransferase